MFRAALNQGEDIAMVAMFRPAVVTIKVKFEEFMAETGARAKRTTFVVEPAMTALRARDTETPQQADRRKSRGTQRVRYDYAGALFDVPRCEQGRTGGSRRFGAE